MAEVSAEALNTLNDELNLQKYKTAAEICNGTMNLLIKSTVEGKTALALCELGDALIKKQAEAAFKTKKDEQGKPFFRGVAFPVCISVNDCVSNFSPLKSEEKTLKPLVAGDLVKLELGKPF